MSRARLAVGLMVVVVLIAVSWWYFGGRDDGLKSAVTERGSIDVTIETVGTLQATSATTVRAAQGGAIAALGAITGDTLDEGDIIIILDSEPFDRAVRFAEGELEQAEFALQLAEERADDNEESLELRLAILSAASRVEVAQDNLTRAIQARRESVVLSPRAGTVIELLVREGDVVGVNQPIARIASASDLVVVADVDELDMPNVQVNAEARFRLDAFPATEVIGRVKSVAPQARQQGGATVFSTEIVFDNPGGIDIRPGMNAEVTIVTVARDGVLLIPETALRTVGDRSYVDVVIDGETEEREIVLGYRGGGRVEVVAGLSDGEHVVLH